MYTREASSKAGPRFMRTVTFGRDQVGSSVDSVKRAVIRSR